MSFKRERLCAWCKRSLFTRPQGNINLCECQIFQYWDYLRLLPEHERENVIVNIYDPQNPCSHYMHLVCVCVHRAYCRRVLGWSPYKKVPCPEFFCQAVYNDYTSLNFIPIDQYIAQYQNQNPEWSIVEELADATSIFSIKEEDSK